MPTTAPFPRLPRWRWLALLALATAGNALPQSRELPVQVNTLTVASLHLPGEAAQWAAQRERVLALLASLQPDVIAIHDVRQTPQHPDPACWLARQLGYGCDFVTADPPSQPLRHGSALLSRHGVAEDGLTLLHGPDQFSAAGMQRLQLGPHLLNVYLACIHPQPDTRDARAHQAADLHAWIAATHDGEPSLIVGDFAAPTDELVRYLPGFQPARRNPTRRPGNAIPPGHSHGADVLYQVRRFADVAQQPLALPAEGQAPALVLGTLATMRLLVADGSSDTSD